MKYTCIYFEPFPSHWWKPLKNLNAIFQNGPYYFMQDAKHCPPVKPSQRKSFETCQIYSIEIP